MTEISHIHQVAARQIHSELVAALGTENTPAQWMTFMEAVAQHLPLVAEAGRPSKAAISQSLIGQLGFASWKAMIEAPIEQQGLGWSYHSWKAWLRAWAVVKAYPYLRQEPLTASAVNQLKLKFKDDFPVDLDALDKANAERKAQSQQNLATQIKSLNEEMGELGAQLAERDHRLQFLGDELQHKEQLIRQLQQDNTLLTAQLSDAKSLSRWQHLRRFFTG